MQAPCKVRVWAVVGEASSGKSSTVGYLISQLGRGPGGFRWVRLRGGGWLQVYGRRQSLQEAKITPQQFVADIAKDARKRERNGGGYMNLLIAIRTDVIKNLPPAYDYLSYFLKSGWDLESLVLLNYEPKIHDRYFGFGVPTYEISDSGQMFQKQLNHQPLVGQVRNHFGWA